MDPPNLWLSLSGISAHTHTREPQNDHFLQFWQQNSQAIYIKGCKARALGGPGGMPKLGVFPPISGPSQEGAEIVKSVMGRWNGTRVQYDPPGQGVETEKIGHFWPILGGTPPRTPKKAPRGGSGGPRGGCPGAAPGPGGQPRPGGASGGPKKG